MEKRQDLRVQKTQKALAKAMFSLLSSIPFPKITINDICTEALVSRSAFYSHFTDKYSLLQFCMGILKENLFQRSQEMPFRERIYFVINHIKDDARTFKNLMMAELDIELLRMLRLSFLEDLKILLDKKDFEKEQTLPGPVELLSVYYSSAITSTITFWISENMKYTVDEMAEFLCALLPEHIVE